MVFKFFYSLREQKIYTKLKVPLAKLIIIFNDTIPKNTPKADHFHNFKPKLHILPEKLVTEIFFGT
jgi:hypothetical protein